MNEVVIAILGSSAGAALINGIFKIAEWVANRKAQKEDRAEAKADSDRLQSDDIGKIKEDINSIKESIAVLMQSNEDLIESNRETLGDRIKHLGLKYIEQGYIKSNDLEDVMRMHKVYHDTLKGNGFYDALMENVLTLPIKKEERNVQK